MSAGISPVKRKTFATLLSLSIFHSNASQSA
jgi:hypothetical protein